MRGEVAHPGSDHSLSVTLTPALPRAKRMRSGSPMTSASLRWTTSLSARVTIAKPRLEQVAAIEAQLRAELEPCRAIAGVADLRVKGAIGAVELDGTVDLDAMRRRFPELGVWVRPFGRIVYLMPPFVIDSADLSTLTGAVRRVLAERAATL